MWHLELPALQLAARAAIVYLAVLALLRAAGKRQVGQMGAAEFVALLLISNAVQNAMNGGDNSVSAGLLLAAVLIALSSLVGWLTYRSRGWENLVAGRPRLLVHQGKLVERNLERERLNPRELRVALREQGIHELSEVEEAVLESNGRISVIKRGEPPAPRA